MIKMIMLIQQLGVFMDWVRDGPKLIKVIPLSYKA